ncbi:DddA-like double-stranded DNA deaminase toxin [Glycomyces niveus]|uniref:Uncharacterized protein n=1 Tax=Glycomyces niveus TaxID=2820287 RepID=A0ABS3U9G3_9ACTN|nr:DddA-like double-stranded DNA deaminase toxin [Glycomyces sp. NEAU-S30]MBO3735424.1 hypothetical protein [Glycomyces sp. NEAU-S30]
MPSVEEVAAALGANKGEAKALAGQLAASKQQAEKLQEQLAALGAEGTASLASAAVQSIEGLMSEAAALSGRIGEAQSQVLAIGQGGLLPSGTKTTVTGQPTAALPRRRIPGFNSNRVNKDAIADIRRAGYPKNAEGKTSARAFVYTADGEQINADALKPYRKGEAPPQPDLKEPWASSEELTTTWHVERDAAAAIRAERLDSAAFYLNVPLCGRRAEGSEYPDPAKCYENFRHIIPKDAVAYVFVVPEQGMPRRRRIVGTGEAIKE